ncbi:MAG TPA: PUA domain-containing protein [Candidatus Lokiarchaeia archaeon]|nr:PUA domain-containing protein [Candidatus Lokiarchaeia archaeon]
MAERVESAREKFASIFLYQFGERVRPIIDRVVSELEFTYSRRTGRMKSILWKGEEYCYFRPDVGLFTLGRVAAQVILDMLPPPNLRAILQDDVGEFIAQGRNAFAKHVVDVDPSLVPEDEIILVDTQDRLLGVGRLVLPASEVKAFSRGVAVKTRKGFEA